MLPQGIALTARWKELLAAYGPAVGDTESGLRVMFCKWPSFIFKIDAADAPVDPAIELRDSSVIPANARILQVMIVRGPLPGWHCPP